MASNLLLAGYDLPRGERSARVEKAPDLAARVYALARGRIVLEASTAEPDLPHRLEHAYFGQDVPSPIH